MVVINQYENSLLKTDMNRAGLEALTESCVETSRKFKLITMPPLSVRIPLMWELGQSQECTEQLIHL